MRKLVAVRRVELLLPARIAVIVSGVIGVCFAWVYSMLSCMLSWLSVAIYVVFVASACRHALSNIHHTMV